jgi:hypothetical protein
MDYISRAKVEQEEEWREWIDKIPPLKFKRNWTVRVIPPFAGAIARFIVETEKGRVSVYLDCYEKLGYFGEPYWEIYPYNGDVYRVKMASADELISAISKSLKQQASRKYKMD